jgi:hypothetical protein
LSSTRPTSQSSLSNLTTNINHSRTISTLCRGTGLNTASWFTQSHRRPISKNLSTASVATQDISTSRHLTRSTTRSLGPVGGRFLRRFRHDTFDTTFANISLGTSTIDHVHPFSLWEYIIVFLSSECDRLHCLNPSISASRRCLKSKQVIYISGNLDHGPSHIA